MDLIFTINFWICLIDLFPCDFFFSFYFQKRQGQCDSKCISEKFIPGEDGGYGFPLEPAKSRALNVFSHSGQSMHPSAYGSSRNMNLKEEDVLTGPNHAFTSTNSELRKQKSFWHGSTAQLSRFSNSVAVRGDSQLDMSGDYSVNSQWPDQDHFDMTYGHLGDGESNQLLDGPKASRKKHFHLHGKDRAMVKKLLANINLCNRSFILESALHAPLRMGEEMSLIGV